MITDLLVVSLFLISGVITAAITYIISTEETKEDLPVVCAWCPDKEEPEGPVSHGICPPCLEQLTKDYDNS